MPVSIAGEERRFFQTHSFRPS